MTVAGYSGKPLHVKLGVREGARVLVRHAPTGFRLDCRYDERADGAPYDVVLLFCPSCTDLAAEWEQATALITVAGALWVAWPKKSSGVRTDLSDGVVRSYALERSLVDVQVCAVDATWSALKMVRRKADR